MILRATPAVDFRVRVLPLMQFEPCCDHHHLAQHASITKTTSCCLLLNAEWELSVYAVQAARERFNEFLQMSSLPADDADVERLRRERREAAAKDGVKFGDADVPDKFYKLPRIRFLLLLCKELLRINRWGGAVICTLGGVLRPLVLKRTNPSVNLLYS